MLHGGGRGRGRGKSNGRDNAAGRRVLEASGRLEAKDVESHIASSASASTSIAAAKTAAKTAASEQVFLKATGRAIPRALELGVRFQMEGCWRVSVSMGNVKAIDDLDVDVDVCSRAAVDGDGAGDENGGRQDGKDDARKQDDREDEDELPETRIRTLSTVTVCIGFA